MFKYVHLAFVGFIILTILPIFDYTILWY